MTLDHFNMTQKMNEHQVKGVSVSLIEDGQLKSMNHYGVSHSKHNNLVDEKTIFNACSISKFVTAVLVMKLVSEGVLFLDKSVNEQLKSWQVAENEYTKNNQVSLRNLLCHQAGLIDPEGSFGVYDSASGRPFMADLLSGTTPYCSERAEVKYEPNTDFIYSDIGYCVIEQLISDVLGLSFGEVIEKMIFEPLGMKDSWIVDKTNADQFINFAHGHTKEGQVLDIAESVYPYPAAAGLWCTSKDLAVLLIELYNLINVNGNGKLGISQSLVMEMIKPQGCKPWSGLGVFLDTVESNIEISSFGWGTGFQCMLVGFPMKRTGAVIMTNTDTGVHQLKGFIGELVSAIYE